VLESGLTHVVHPIDMRSGQHKSSKYLAINPNGQMPAMVDDDGPDGAAITLMQSLGILYYVAGKYDHLIPTDPRLQVEAWDWCLFSATDLYPMCALAWRDFPQWHDLAGVQRWMQRTAARPAVSEAMNWFRDRSPQFEREFV
jgi:glutathione S-transferase